MRVQRRPGRGAGARPRGAAAAGRAAVGAVRLPGAAPRQPQHAAGARLPRLHRALWARVHLRASGRLQRLPAGAGLPAAPHPPHPPLPGLRASHQPGCNRGLLRGLLRSLLLELPWYRARFRVVWARQKQ